MIFPWQQEQWQQLKQARQENRLHHAILLAGIEGLGKSIFAETLAASLFCSAPNASEGPCGACQDCHLLTTEAHPGLIRVVPEKEGAIIKVDQIREVSEFINQTALRGQYRIVIINPADNMNTSAANALLKTLEEPPAHALLLLISHQAGQLSPTILSRCQRIVFRRPPRDQALTWLTKALDPNLDASLMLAIANGAPLTASSYADNDQLSLRKTLFDTLWLLSKQEENPIKAAASLQALDTLPLIDLMLSWVIDLLRIQFHHPHVVNQDYITQLTALSQKSLPNHYAGWMEYLFTLRKQSCAGINFNKQLLIENLLVRWMPN